MYVPEAWEEEVKLGRNVTEKDIVVKKAMKILDNANVYSICYTKKTGIYSIRFARSRRWSFYYLLRLVKEFEKSLPKGYKVINNNYKDRSDETNWDWFNPCKLLVKKD